MNYRLPQIGELVAEDGWKNGSVRYIGVISKVPGDCLHDLIVEIILSTGRHTKEEIEWSREFNSWLVIPPEKHFATNQIRDEIDKEILKDLQSAINIKISKWSNRL